MAFTIESAQTKSCTWICILNWANRKSLKFMENTENVCIVFYVCQQYFALKCSIQKQIQTQIDNWV